MAFTFIASAGNSDDASGTTLDCSSSLNVEAGDLLVAWTKNEGAPTTHAMAKSTGSPANTFTYDAADTEDHSNADLSGAFGYVLAAAADATATFRMTLGAARPYRRVLVMQFRPDGGETVTRDAGNNGQGNSSALSSGNVTTTGTDEVICGGYGEYGTRTASSEQVGGVAATEPAASPQGGYTAAWYLIATSTFTGAATATLDADTEWVCGAIAFKSEAVASDVTIVSKRMSGWQYSS